MSKYKVQGLVVNYMEEVEIDAIDEEDATYKYYLKYKANELEVVNTEFEITQKDMEIE